MLRLYVLRHAKSSWAVPGARDFDRELNDRGVRDSEMLSRVMRNKDYIPEQILCSPSVRTRQTYNGIVSALPETTEVDFSERLYSSGLAEYIELIHEKGSGQSLMIIGHNPMCGALASALPKHDSDYPLDTIAYKYPTATMAVIDFNISEWADLSKGAGNLIDCVIPSHL